MNVSRKIKLCNAIISVNYFIQFLHILTLSVYLTCQILEKYVLASPTMGMVLLNFHFTHKGLGMTCVCAVLFNI